MKYDFAIIGAGIVGLSTAHALALRYPKASILIIEKEDSVAAHQTGRNSGVLHSGIYYKPGGFKARFCRAGNRSMAEFCRTHDIAYEICGKVIVATEHKELPLLNKLYERGIQNELAVEKIEPEALRQVEPHVNGLAAIRVLSAGIVDYKQVCQTLVRLLLESGAELKLKHRVTAIRAKTDTIEIDSDASGFTASHLINCAGLYSDRVAELSGAALNLQIIPFRGEYFEIRPERRHLVKHLIYPVPNPDFPFLGVHYTRMTNGSVEAGPNAVLAFAREGYRKTDFRIQDFGETLMYGGFRKFARRHWKEGMVEMWRSISKHAFVKSLQRLIPEIRNEDLIPREAGIRAQAMNPDGGLVDDFHIVEQRRCTHVCNAPSPAATAAIEIGRHIAAMITLR